MRALIKDPKTRLHASPACWADHIQKCLCFTMTVGLPHFKVNPVELVVFFLFFTCFFPPLFPPRFDHFLSRYKRIKNRDEGDMQGQFFSTSFPLASSLVSPYCSHSETSQRLGPLPPPEWTGENSSFIFGFQILKVIEDAPLESWNMYSIKHQDLSKYSPSSGSGSPLLSDYLDFSRVRNPSN